MKLIFRWYETSWNDINIVFGIRNWKEKTFPILVAKFYVKVRVHHLRDLMHFPCTYFIINMNKSNRILKFYEPFPLECFVDQNPIYSHFFCIKNLYFHSQIHIFLSFRHTHPLRISNKTHGLNILDNYRVLAKKKSVARMGHFVFKVHNNIDILEFFVIRSNS